MAWLTQQLWHFVCWCDVLLKASWRPTACQGETPRREEGLVEGRGRVQDRLQVTNIQGEKTYISQIRHLKGHANSHKTTIHASTCRTSNFLHLADLQPRLWHLDPWSRKKDRDQDSDRYCRWSDDVRLGNRYGSRLGDARNHVQSALKIGPLWTELNCHSSS